MPGRRPPLGLSLARGARGGCCSRTGPSPLQGGCSQAVADSAAKQRGPGTVCGGLTGWWTRATFRPWSTKPLFIQVHISRQSGWRLGAYMGIFTNTAEPRLTILIRSRGSKHPSRHLSER